MVGKRQKSSRNPSLTLNVLVPEVELVWLWFSKGSFHPLSFGSISLMSHATVSTHSFLGLLQDHDPLGTTFHCLSCFSASNNENTVLLNPQSVSVVSFFYSPPFFFFVFISGLCTGFVCILSAIHSVEFWRSEWCQVFKQGHDAERLRRYLQNI